MTQNRCTLFYGHLKGEGHVVLEVALTSGTCNVSSMNRMAKGMSEVSA